MASLLSFLVRRIAQGIVIVILASFVVFGLLRIGPGSPARLLAGGLSDQASVDALASSMGLADPIPVQYVRYIRDIFLHGDFGRSYVRPKSGGAVGGGHAGDPTKRDRAAVLQLIADRLPLSLQLAGVGLGFALMLSVPIGLFAGLNATRWPESAALVVSSLLVSMPNFWFAGLLVLAVSIQLQWLPPVGYAGFSYVILPAVVLAVEIAPILVRALSMSMAATLQRSYVKIGPVRGLTRWQVVIGHALRGAAVPLLNTFGVLLTGLLGSLLVVEFIFDYPGLGAITVEAVMQRDFPLIQGIAVVTSAFFVIVNILVDLLAGMIDPRLDY
ncbi:ABC-type dipeptide/oligopeptide/nickel transport system permease component [Bradyrhizobium sp. USDA 4369]